jgi:hypothetical protein
LNGHAIPDHTPTGSFASDCKSCHAYPGTGTAAAPNWLGASGYMPPTITLAVTANSTWGSPTSITLDHPKQITTTTTHAITSSDCTICHANYNSTASIQAWDHQTFTLNGAPQTQVNCGWCHTQISQVLNGSILGGQSATRVSLPHHGLNQATSCTNCHTYTLPKWNGSSYQGGGFAGG